MSNPVPIYVAGRTVGTIFFEESDAALTRDGARRTVDGFRFTIPARLTLEWQQGKEGWQPLVSNLRAEVLVDDESGMELGVAEDINSYLPLNPRLPDKPLALQWRASLAAIDLLEKRRGNSPPKLLLRCFGEVCPLYTPDGARSFMPNFRGAPERIFSDVHLIYPRNTWRALLDGNSRTGKTLVR
jgi:hypothetical protein